MFNKPDPSVAASGFKATKDDADAALSAVGNKVTDCGDNTFYFIFDEPLPVDDDYLITVDVKGHTYGICSPASSRKATPGCIKLYFQLNNGKQVDFLDGKKKQADAEAVCDLSDFTGTATMTLYKTDKQEDGVYPTGLEKLKLKTIQISNGA